MIAACPKCQTRYRVEPERLGADGARLRCSQCSAVFRVRLPAAPVAAPEAAAPIAAVAPEPPERTRLEAPAPLEAPTTAAPAPRALQRSVERPGVEAPQFDRSRLVLFAHPDPDACKPIAEALEREGLQVLVAHDGVEAILSIQRALPRAVVLDAALPKMFGFQVCELVKRNESLRVTHVCLIGAIHRDDRYRRAPNEIYGADFYIESPSLPGALIDWLGRVGFDLRSRPDETTPTPTPDPTPDPIPTALTSFEAPELGKAPASDAAALGGVVRSEPQASEVHQARAPDGYGALSAEGRSVATTPEPPEVEAPADPLAAARAQAERLARIIVSDIVLYNEEKFSAAVRGGSVLETMRDELKEGRALFRERIDPAVRDERDFLADELVRVARGRGAS